MQGNFLGFCLLFSSVWAADTGMLRGIVHDSQHRPLPGAQVTLRGSVTTINKAIIYFPYQSVVHSYSAE